MKKKILKDYEGSVIEIYLDKISKRFINDAHFSDLFNQYTEYGLLFPPIPDTLKSGWKSERVIQLDNNIDSSLMETIKYISEDEDFRFYSIDLANIPEQTSTIKISKAEGHLQWNKKTKMSEIVKVNIQYTYDDTITSEYDFELTKI